MQYARECTWSRRRYEYLWFRSMRLIFPYYSDQTQKYALIYCIHIINNKR